MPDILSRAEFEAAQRGTVTHTIPGPVLATIEALARALRITERVLIEDTAEENEMSKQLHRLRNLGWLE